MNETRRHHEELQMLPALAGPLTLAGSVLMAGAGALWLKMKGGPRK